MQNDRLTEIIKELVIELGEDTNRQGLLKTPERVADSFRFLTSGYRESVDDIVRDSIFDEDDNQMVIVRNVEFYSLCEHHLLPFFGKCHVAYIPQGKIIGISKINRIINHFARKLQVQERLTNEIASTLQSKINPSGVAVVVEAKHLCMMMRGIQKQSAEMVTSRMIGDFMKRPETRQEFLSLIGKKD